jgi:DNA polymerase/3'-5' exonuclease PolX
MPSLKKDLDPMSARKIAADFLERTSDLYERAELAGSLRRKAPVVHDIDFAVIPKGDDFGRWKEEVKQRVDKIGGAVISFGEIISDFAYKGAQVNLFLCPGPESWGVTLMWATGPKGHTIGMTIKARNMGLLINSRGIWTRGDPPRLVTARTEQEVGKILDWKYKPPETRGKDTKKEQAYY